MGFDYLLKHAVKPGETSCEEEGKGVFLERQEGETIIVFHLDNPRVRTQFSLTGKPCCDYLLFYGSKDRPAFLLFIELKGRDGIETAAKQIQSAYGSLCPDRSALRSDAKGLIVSPDGAPKNQKELQKSLAQDGVNLFFGRSDKKNKCDLRGVQGLKAYFQSSDRKRHR